MSSQNPPPGWHPDPHDPGQQRYWDGQAWTDQYAPIAQTPEIAGSSAPGKPWYKKKRFMIPIGVVAVLVAISAASGGSADDKKDATTAASTESDADKDAKDAADKAAEDAKDAADKAAEDAKDAADKAAEDAKDAADKAAEDAKDAADKAAKEAASKPIPVKAAALIKEYEDNELAADSKYDGKRLLISGVLSKVDTELFDSNDYTLLINGGGEYEFLSVTAYDVPQADIAKLTTGQKVTVVCDFKDGGDLGVEVNHCKMG